jgi:putative ABC transport system permease protein
MEPLMLLLHRERLGRFIHFSVKIAPQDRVKTVDFIKRKFEIYFPEGIFDFQFYDDFFASFFVMSENIGKLIGYFSLLAFFIASLGLFALVLFSVKQRTKEIGIRKVFGASITNIFFLLSKEFLQIVVIANLIAWPLTYYILGKVLQTFPARVSLKPWIFLLSGLISFMVAIVSVSFQSIKAAAAKPISSLRYE